MKPFYNNNHINLNNLFTSEYINIIEEGKKVEKLTKATYEFSGDPKKVMSLSFKIVGDDSITADNLYGFKEVSTLDGIKNAISRLVSCPNIRFTAESDTTSHNSHTAPRDEFDASPSGEFDTDITIL